MSTTASSGSKSADVRGERNKQQTEYERRNRPRSLSREGRGAQVDIKPNSFEKAAFTQQSSGAPLAVNVAPAAVVGGGQQAVMQM